MVLNKSCYVSVPTYIGYLLSVSLVAQWVVGCAWDPGSDPWVGSIFLPNWCCYEILSVILNSGSGELGIKHLILLVLRLISLWLCHTCLPSII